MNEAWGKRIEKVTKIDVRFFTEDAQGNITRKDLSGLDPSMTLKSLGIEKENNHIKIFSLSWASYAKDGSFNPLELDDSFTLKKILERSVFITGCKHQNCNCDLIPKLDIYIAANFPNKLLQDVRIELRNLNERRISYFRLQDSVADIKSSFFSKEDMDSDAEIWFEKMTCHEFSDDHQKFTLGDDLVLKLTDEQLMYDILKFFPKNVTDNEPTMKLKKTPPESAYSAIKAAHKYNLSQMYLPQKSNYNVPQPPRESEKRTTFGMW